MNLDATRRNVTSQHGEDGILEAIFTVLGVSRGVCVEFGAWDGKKDSNTHNLIVNHGWCGVLIEANRLRFNDLLTTYRERTDVLKINRIVGFDPPDTLDEILKDAGAPADLDLVSIDIDGNDYHVFEAMQVRPKVVVVEFNPSIPNTFRFIQARDLRCNQGSSLLALALLAKEKGYELAATTITNAVFVRADLFDALKIEDNSIEALHKDTSHQTFIFQLYDGTLICGGVNKLMWHEDAPKIHVPQVLPRELRRFPDALDKEESK